MIRPSLVTGVALAVFALAAPLAAAHVTVNPNEAEAGSFSRFAVRVPTERPDASTTEVTLRLPEGMFFVSFQPKPGWKRTVKMEKLAEPAEVFGDEITERVAEVTWTGGEIAPGEFDEFGMSARVPEEAGTELVFPAVQTYSSGEVVRWIGEPDADQPAPRVAVLPPAEEEEEEQPAAGEDDDGTETTAAAAADDSAVDDAESRANLALGLGIAGLIAGAVALALVLLRGPRRA